MVLARSFCTLKLFCCVRVCARVYVGRQSFQFRSERPLDASALLLRNILHRQVGFSGSGQKSVQLIFGLALAQKLEFYPASLKGGPS